MSTNITNSLNKQVLYKRRTVITRQSHSRRGGNKKKKDQSLPFAHFITTHPSNKCSCFCSNDGARVPSAVLDRCTLTHRALQKSPRCCVRCKRSSNFPLMRCPLQRQKPCAHHTFTSETCHCFIAAPPPYSVGIWGNSLQAAARDSQAITALG